MLLRFEKGNLLNFCGFIDLSCHVGIRVILALSRTLLIFRVKLHKNHSGLKLQQVRFANFKIL